MGFKMVSHKRLIKLFLKVVLIIIGIAGLSLFAIILIDEWRDKRVFPCGARMTILGNAIIAYDKRYGHVPDPNRWCDLLIEKVGRYEAFFVCPRSDAVEWESSYAMNKNLTGMRIEDIPSDVVVLFETDLGKNTWKCPRRERSSYKERSDKKYGDVQVWKYRWNQCGGPEIMTTARHGQRRLWWGWSGSLICYINPKTLRTEIHFVSEEEAKNLKWDPRADRVK